MYNSKTYPFPTPGHCPGRAVVDQEDFSGPVGLQEVMFVHVLEDDIVSINIEVQNPAPVVVINPTGHLNVGKYQKRMDMSQVATLCSSA